MTGSGRSSQSPRGVCIWLTGRSGAGKSTLVEALIPRFEAIGRTYSVLDVVPLLARKWCERTSEGKLHRKAFVAGEIARHGGIAICVTVSARAETRERARQIVGPQNFVEVLVDVPPEVAAARKGARGRKPSLRKRMKRARRSLLRLLGRRTTGYQAPESPDVVVDATGESPEAGAAAIVSFLEKQGFLATTVKGDQS